MGLIPGSGSSPGEGNGNPLQYSCLENPMDRGAWRAVVHSIANNQTRLKRLSTTHTSRFYNLKICFFFFIFFKYFDFPVYLLCFFLISSLLKALTRLF